MNWQHVSNEQLKKMKETNSYIKGFMFFSGLALMLTGLMFIYKGITKYNNNYDDVIGIIVGIIFIIISALLVIIPLCINKKTLYRCDISEIYFSTQAEFINPRKLKKNKSVEYLCDIRISEPNAANLQNIRQQNEKLISAYKLSRHEYDNIVSDPPQVFGGYKDNKFTFIGTGSLVYTSAAVKIIFFVMILCFDMIIISAPLTGKLTLCFRFFASLTTLVSLLYYVFRFLKSCTEHFKTTLVITAAAGIVITYCVPVRNIMNCVSDFENGTREVITSEYDLSVHKNKNSKTYRVTLYDDERELEYVISYKTYKRLKNVPYSELAVSYYKNTGLCRSLDIS
ncbi:MAG: hypothetical protein Q4F95_15595 [Oscillospiraceae bacterium]|nr:hypothetical protein [Oscillospiraceae bacterium]